MPYRARVRTDQIALQLWTVRTLTATDVPGTLRAVAAAGYRAVELAAIGHVDPVVLRTVLDDNGLSVVASHEPMAGLREDPAAVAARLAVLGCPRVIVPWLPEEERLTHSDVRRYADDLGRLAGVFADHGLDLTVPRGQVFALLGPNGAGKSSTASGSAITTTTSSSPRSTARPSGRSCWPSCLPRSAWNSMSTGPHEPDRTR